MGTINVRNIPDSSAARIKRSAKARGMTLALYFVSLADLHENIRALADAGDAQLKYELNLLGLESVDV